MPAIQPCCFVPEVPPENSGQSRVPQGFSRWYSFLLDEQPCLYIIAFDMPAHPVRMNTIESIPEELYSGLNSQVAPLAQSSKVVLLAVLFIPVQMVNG